MFRRLYLWIALVMSWPVSHMVYAEDMNLIITLDRADLQRRVERMFPIIHEDDVVAVRIHHPQVILTEHSDRIGLRIRIDATAVTQFSASGVASVDGALRFASTSGNFYLDEPHVEELDIDGVPSPYMDQIRQLTDGLVGNLLQNRPIYTLGQMGETKRIMGSEIKSINVHKGKLNVELAMP